MFRPRSAGHPGRRRPSFRAPLLGSSWPASSPGVRHPARAATGTSSRSALATQLTRCQAGAAGREVSACRDCRRAAPPTGLPQPGQAILSARPGPVTTRRSSVTVKSSRRARLRCCPAAQRSYLIFIKPLIRPARRKPRCREIKPRITVWSTWPGWCGTAGRRAGARDGERRVNRCRSRTLPLGCLSRGRRQSSGSQSGISPKPGSGENASGSGPASAARTTRKESSAG